MSRKRAEFAMKSHEIIKLGSYRFDPSDKTLRDSSGGVVPLRSQSADVLAYLAQRHGQIVGKDDIISAIWRDTFVTDDSLVQCIADIRRALGDQEHALVQTHPKQGYRLLVTYTEGRREVSLKSRRIAFPFRIAAVVAVVLLSIASLVLWQPRPTVRQSPVPDDAPLSLPMKPSIAVLAFSDLSKGANADFLSDAIAEGIITELSRFAELFVVARNSSFSYRDQSTDVRDIARDLGVRYVLEGSQQKAGNRLRVTAKLIDAVSGNHVWAETYDRDIEDVLTLQAEITRTVAATVAPRLIVAATNEAARLDANNLEAFAHWLRGNRLLYDYTRESTAKAQSEFLAALAADPNMARGHVGLAYVYINGVRWGWTDLERGLALDLALKEAQTALDLAPEDYYAHETMAYILMQAGEHEAAITKFRVALQLNPNSADVRASMSEALSYTGQIPEAISLIQEAMRLDPHHPDWFNWVLAWLQWYTGDCEEGLASMDRMAQLPNLARRTLASLYVCVGDVPKARSVIHKFLEQEPGYSIADVRASLAHKYKKPADLERWIDDLRKAGLPE
ncbi:winged helix-turn-helix domain-containing protein [Defluviimonas sp. WL0024]|uniref:Winged helix-turn-helix domain-containing protein n=2 Tax=Albidovulum TaxID=205889 RepID=A0ABT3JA47_9RHOB|nr:MULTISPECIES: winged helix-turn-helix domain-containing protein [Defluviimonas]MCU9848931.1 winged helix-turn-helix domain-containing protein [Defluviimonas sp. WL0024]MCW3784566.1 winged helix-turn-helix domain-containing protein [Defluviimonas salinarum]